MVSAREAQHGAVLREWCIAPGGCISVCGGLWIFWKGRAFLGRLIMVCVQEYGGNRHLGRSVWGGDERGVGRGLGRVYCYFLLAFGCRFRLIRSYGCR